MRRSADKAAVHLHKIDPEHSMSSHQVDFAVDPRKHLPLRIVPVLQPESCPELRL